MSRKNGKVSAQKSDESFWGKILRWGTVLVFAVLPLLYFPGRAGSYVTSKEFFFIGIVDLLSCVWVFVMLADVRYRLSRKNLAVFAPLFLFLIAGTVSAIVGVNPLISFFSTIESGTGMIVLWHAFLFALIVASLIRARGEKMVKATAQAMLFSGVILAIMTWFTNVVWNVGSAMLNNSSGGAMMGNVLLAAAYLIFVVFLGIVLIARESSKSKKWIYAIGVFVILVSPVFFLAPSVWQGMVPFKDIFHNPILLLGQARAADVALAIGVMISFFIWIAFSNGKKFFKIFGICGVCLVLLATVFGIQQAVSHDGIFHKTFVENAGARPQDWNVAIQGFKQKPVFGWGPENFQIVELQHLDPYVFSPQNDNQIYALHPHNVSLEILMDNGIVGFVVYIFMFIALISQIIFLSRREKISGAIAALLIGMIVAYFLQDQMIYDSMASYVIFFAVIGMVAGWADLGESDRSNSIPGWAKYATGILVVAVAIPIWIFAAYLPARKTIEMQNISGQASNVRIDNYHHLFQGGAAYFFQTDPEFYTLTLADSYNEQRSLFKNNPGDAKIASAEIQVVLDEMDAIAPHETTDYRFALSGLELENLQIFLQGGTPDPALLAKAQIYFTQAAALSLGNVQIYLAYAETMIDRDNVAGAQELFTKAFSINPDNSELLADYANFQKFFSNRTP